LIEAVGVSLVRLSPWATKRTATTHDALSGFGYRRVAEWKIFFSFDEGLLLDKWVLAAYFANYN